MANKAAVERQVLFFIEKNYDTIWNFLTEKLFCSGSENLSRNLSQGSLKGFRKEKDRHAYPDSASYTDNRAELFLYNIANSQIKKFHFNKFL